MFSLQRAGMWKRISAFLFDGILMVILAVLFALALSGLLGYDGYMNTLTQSYEHYGQEYGIDLQMSLSEYEKLSPEDMQRLDEAYAALGQDVEAQYAYRMMMTLTVVILSISLLLGFVALEVLIPAWLGDGQTLGKKIFSLGVMQEDGVRLGGVGLFVRSILGKYTIGTMVPALIVLMLYFGSLNLPGTIALLGLTLLQLGLWLFTYRHTPIHDLLAHTVVVDLPSQKIFPNREALIAYKEQAAAEKAAARPY